MIRQKGQRWITQPSMAQRLAETRRAGPASRYTSSTRTLTPLPPAQPPLAAPSSNPPRDKPHGLREATILAPEGQSFTAAKAIP